jgi:hypothetical protein
MPLDATAPATTSPAAVETPAAPTGAPPERSLADYIADHAAEVQRNVSRASGQPAPAAETPAAPAVAPEVVPAETTTTPDVAAPEVVAVVTPPVQSPEDERAVALATYIRGKRQNSAEAARLKSEDARIRAEAERITSREAEAAKIIALRERAAKDPVGAVEELLGKDRFGNDFLLAALDRVSKGDAGQPLTEEQRQAVIADAAVAKVKAELKAEREAEEAARKAAREAEDRQGQAAYFNRVGEVLKAKAVDYPMMAAEGWNTTDMVAAVEKHRELTGQWPTSDQVLTHFEGLHVARAERLLAVRNKGKAPVAPVPLAASPAAAPVRGTAVDSGGRSGKKIEEGSYEERRKAIMARLDGRVAG